MPDTSNVAVDRTDAGSVLTLGIVHAGVRVSVLFKCQVEGRSGEGSLLLAA